MCDNFLIALLYFAFRTTSFKKLAVIFFIYKTLKLYKSWFCQNAPTISQYTYTTTVLIMSQYINAKVYVVAF